MFTLEFYQDIDTIRRSTFDTKEKAVECAKSILSNVYEFRNSYCMVWEGKTMVDFIQL